MLISNNDYSLALSGRMRPASTELRLASAQCWLAASSFIRCISASQMWRHYWQNGFAMRQILNLRIAVFWLYTCCTCWLTSSHEFEVIHIYVKYNIFSNSDETNSHYTWSTILSFRRWDEIDGHKFHYLYHRWMWFSHFNRKSHMLGWCVWDIIKLDWYQRLNVYKLYWKTCELPCDRLFKTHFHLITQEAARNMICV